VEKELFLSGYCRALDGSRTVCILLEDGNLEEADCDFPSCPHMKDCTIAKGIEASLQENNNWRNS
jgi:hypothetical protein